ncbi:hypothetical protein [Cobetia sp. MB87]|uniref:hypothetical protein n=1 Tax=Cobetia sp. MB87 TaxID=2588451 RepID=UPI00140B9E05|nr:hypothetical protein [Cobetia sp. MB87]
MHDKVILVALNDEQKAEAVQAQSSRKKITHAVVCGDYGTIFGTEKYCLKYFHAWSSIFPNIFSGGEFSDSFQFVTYQPTYELVNILMVANDEAKKSSP